MRRAEHESVGGELAAVAGEAGGPSELVTDDFEATRPRYARAGELIGHLSTGGGPDGIVTITDREGHQVARTTAHDGEYAVQGLAPGTYTAVATAPGFRPAVAAVTVNGVGVVRDFSLDGNGVVAGSVTGPDGRGRAGALVIATDAAGTVVGRAHTATDGSFRMAGLPVGATTLAASVPEHEPDAVTVDVDHAGTATADLVLASSQGGVAGVVTGPDARPLARATVVVTGPDGSVVGRATTDDDGRYALAGLRSGTYTVVASLLTPASTEVRVPAGDPVQVDLRLGDPAGTRAAR